MRQVKCRDTGILVSASDAWKAPDGKYYSSQGAFNHLIHEREYKQKCLEELGNLLGYSEGQKFPTIVAKKLKEYESYGYEVVLKTILDKKEIIGYAIDTKNFNSEYNKVAYVMAIITNNINDVYKKFKSASRADVSTKTDITMEEIQSMSTPVSNKDIHDISSFL